MVPFPPKNQYLTAIKQSSHELRVSAGILIKPDAITRLLSSPAFTNSFTRVSKNHGLGLPLKFSSSLDELNFLSILSLLNFASGYRVPLHLRTGRGAWDTIRALMFGLYITSSSGEGDLLSANGLRVISTSKIAEIISIDLHVERPHESIPGVIVGELGGPLYELVKMIAGVLNETGEILENTGYQNLGAFVAESLKDGERSGTQGIAEVLLEKLVQAFPAFRDMSELQGKPIYCFKKALFLIEAIAIRFGNNSEPPFPVPVTSHLPVFSDNVLPSLLIHLGVINLSSSILSNIFPDAGSEASLELLLGAGPPPDFERSAGPPKEGPVVTNEQAYILRAAAIDACEMIVKAAKCFDWKSSIPEAKNLGWINGITLPDLDMWIWAVAKDRPDYRALERFVAKETIYF